jgi:hypothetical protein
MRATVCLYAIPATPFTTRNTLRRSMRCLSNAHRQKRTHSQGLADDDVQGAEKTLNQMLSVFEIGVLTLRSWPSEGRSDTAGVFRFGLGLTGEPLMVLQ